MAVCRICLKQSHKQVFDLDYGSPSIRAKLLTCISNINSRFFDSNYCICESCFNALNTAYELREMQMAAEAEIKSIMVNSDDYANLNKYVTEAAKRREKLYNNKIQVREDGILLNDIKEEEQLAAIATIDSTPSISATTAETQPPRPCKRSRTLKTLCPASNPFSLCPVNPFGQNLLPPTLRDLDPLSPPPEGCPVIPGTSDPQDLLTPSHAKMCHICFRQYPNRTCLMSHVRSVHSTHVQGKAKMLRRTGLNRKLCLLSPDEMHAIHVEVAKECVATKCHECRITLRCNHELQYHIAAIHKCCPINIVNFNVTCDVCSSSFGHKYLQLHLKGHKLQVKLTNVVDDATTQNGEDSVVGAEDAAQYWLCQICKTMFRSDDHSVEEHLKVHEVVST